MSSTLPSDLLGGGAAVVLGAAVLWASYLAGCSFVGRGASTSVRWCATAVVAAWLLVAAFWLLVPFGLFRLPVALALLIGVAAVLHRRLGAAVDPGARLGEDLRRAREVAGSLARRPAGWAMGALFLVAGLGLLRGTASPPLGWDALTYHLYKAGRWVQLGDLAPQPAPDAWSYYEYFPVVGDAYWAWVMLPVRSDLLITAAGALIWAVLLLGVYAAARELGAAPERSALAAAAVSAMPSVLPYLSSGYVDNTVAALFALGALFVVRVWRSRALAEAPLAAGALALMVGTKLTTAAFFAVGALMVVVAVLRSGAGARARRLALLGCLAAAVAGFPSYQRAWIEAGSPFHPFTIAIGGVVLSPGVEASNEIVPALQAREEYRLDSRADFWRYFLYLPKLHGAFLNPGPGGALIVLFGLLGLARLAREPGRRTVAVFLAACALLMLLGFLSGNMETFRTTVKVTTAGRYVTVGLVAMAILGASWPAAMATPLWLTAVAAGLILSFPRGWAPAEGPALAEVAAAVIAVAAGLWLASWWRSRARRPVLAAVAGLLLVAAGLAAIEGARRRHRYALYEAAADPIDPVFHMHNFSPVIGGAWPLWQALDEPGRPHRLAVTAGWDGLGHNWYRYPLLAGELQNRVLYVPVTADGGIVDYREPEEVGGRASLADWLERLAEAEVDHVVSLAPRTTIEDYWMRSLPGVFSPVLADADAFNVVYRFDPEAARQTLRALEQAGESAAEAAGPAGAASQVP